MYKFNKCKQQTAVAAKMPQQQSVLIFF